MESPNKRLKPSPPEQAADSADFVSFDLDDDDNEDQYGYTNSTPPPELSTSQGISNAPSEAPRGPRGSNQRRDPRSDPRHARDMPKSAHPLPGHEPWILVRTKFGRYFMHNKETKESLWRTPPELKDAVRELQQGQALETEKAQNARWAEEQLKVMRGPATGANGTKVAEGRGQREEGRSRRRRSESLQKEDEEALMAEMAAEAERVEEKDAREAVKGVEGLQPKILQATEAGYGSDISYEEVEVTDSEGEDGEDKAARRAAAAVGQDVGAGKEEEEDGPVEFGEDDIAWQLAAMEQDQDQDMDQPDDEDEDPMDYSDEDDVSDQEAALHFRTMLDDHNISPFTPWDNLLNNEDILYDDRHTLLPNTRTRKAVWEEWVKDTAARLKEERAKAEQQDPKIPYLAFLAEKATPKLYWPEFKRKYKKESIMNQRKLSDKDREKLYRDHISRLKLPESTRKADLANLLSSIPLRALNRSTTFDTLPSQLLGHLHFISLPTPVRDPIILKHISTLPPVPAGEDDDEVRDVEGEKKREKQERALAERERKVEEERRKAEKEGRWAKREAKEAEREIRDATLTVGNRGLREQLRSG
ncbi:hypothetical protein LTR09_007118 [Extremus antarcticus]|uniref:WW domain-containing protein n=1 Tax=Extremus antarcticus TaxID=702011 RepID=A0AAJ0DJW3_9PEZI|nr:hypothetical protein LTR09_007118 [Extremus antarcticus]